MAMLGAFGVTLMLCSTAGVTVMVVLLVMLPTVAVSVLVPVPVAVARPAFTVATAVDCELHTAVVVRFCVVPSE